MSYGTIRAFVGPNGSGKTLAAVVLGVLPSWKQGRPVVANTALYPERLGYLKSLGQGLPSWRDITVARDCTLFLDEITACLPSRSYGSMPPELQRVLNQLRKQDVDVLWTAPNWSRCDVILREVTQEVVVCKGYWSDPYERDRDGYVRNHKGRRVRRASRWPANRVFRWAGFDALEYDDFQNRASVTLKPKWSKWYWRTRHDDQWAYETLQPVSLLDHLDDIGTCMHCGGSRTRHKCRCVATRHDEQGGDEAPEAPAPPDPASLPYFVKVGG